MVPQARARGIEPLVIPELRRELAAGGDARALLKLYRLFHHWCPHVVETHTAKAGTLGRLAALLARVPVRIHVFHGHVFHGYFGPAKTRLFLEIERALARASTRIIALGDIQRRELLDYSLGGPEKVVSIPLGLELSPFLDAVHRGGALRAELGLATSDPARTPLLGIVGRLVPIKAHQVFLAAAARILTDAPGAHFVVAGDGERRAELEALSARPPLAGHVHFLGWRSHMPELYRDLDVVVLTSDNEGMPSTVIEAMAAARPVVATDVGGIRDLLAHGQTGLVVPKRNPQRVAEACLHLIRHPDLRQQMGAAARRAAYPRYDVSTLLATMADFYTSLVRADAHASAPAYKSNRPFIIR